jgi:hypothetical protein
MRLPTDLYRLSEFQFIRGGGGVSLLSARPENPSSIQGRGRIFSILHITPSQTAQGLTQLHILWLTGNPPPMVKHPSF